MSMFASTLEYSILHKLNWEQQPYIQNFHMFKRNKKLIWPYNTNMWACAELNLSGNCYNHRFSQDLESMILMETD